MSEQGKETWLEGSVRSYRRAPQQGKPFLGLMFECTDGRSWVIDYSEKSLFHAFADRQVVISGEPIEPKKRSQHLIENHLRVSTLRLSEVRADAEHIRVGNASRLSGRFKSACADIPGVVLSFTVEQGDTFFVGNDPSGAILGVLIEVWAYLPEAFPSSLPLPADKFLWLVCPCSEAVTWDFRGPSGIGRSLQQRL